MRHATVRVLAIAALLVAAAAVPPATRAGVPFGTHDGPEGPQSQNTCSAWGWAVDPDDPTAVVTVRVLVDGVELRRGPADDYRGDLVAAGVSPTGRASFAFSLWGDVTTDRWHDILVQALDVGTSDTWVPINLTPRRITCHAYDPYDFQLFVKDLASGETRQLTTTVERGEWNPDWAPDGTRIVHDVVLVDPSAVHGERSSLGITTVSTGQTRSIRGTFGGNDGDWSPDGTWLAFDRVTIGDRSVYRIPASGGTRQLIRRDAVSADISPSGRRVLFLQPSTSRLMTVDPSGLRPVVVATLRTSVTRQQNFWFDTNPVWSPDGRWIAYADGGHIWKIRVASSGAPLARPVRVTAGKATADQPTWSADGQSILYQARYGDDTRIWRIASSGGIPSEVTSGPGLNGFGGDYNPAESPLGGAIVYVSVPRVVPPA